MYNNSNSNSTSKNWRDKKLGTLTSTADWPINTKQRGEWNNYWEEKTLRNNMMNLIYDYIVKANNRNEVAKEIKSMVASSDVVIKYTDELLLTILRLTGDSRFPHIKPQDMNVLVESLYDMLFAECQLQVLVKTFNQNLAVILYELFRGSAKISENILNIFLEGYRNGFMSSKEAAAIFMVKKNNLNILHFCCYLGTAKQLQQLKAFCSYFVDNNVIKPIIIQDLFLSVGLENFTPILHITHHGDTAMLKTYLDWLDEMLYTQLKLNKDIVDIHAAQNSKLFTPMQSVLQNSKEGAAHIYLKYVLTKVDTNKDFRVLVSKQLFSSINSDGFTHYHSAANCKNLNNFTDLMDVTIYLLSTNGNEGRDKDDLKAILLKQNDHGYNVVHQLAHNNNEKGLKCLMEVLYGMYDKAEGAKIIFELLSATNLYGRAPNAKLNCTEMNNLLQHYLTEAEQTLSILAVKESAPIAQL